jgi:hypothetical protein
MILLFVLVAALLYPNDDRMIDGLEGELMAPGSETSGKAGGL